uniref:Anaphase-promoting complex subunit 10 n=2 Tax=Bos TaxID=9903 RepID=A0AAA9RVM7_BOVIN
MSPRCLDRGRLQLKANPLQSIHVPGETDSPCGGERRDQIGACFSLLSHTACSSGHRPKWRCPAAASRMPQGRNARARQGAPGGAVERGREGRLGLTSLYCDPSDISGEARRAWEAEWEWRGAAADPEKLSGSKQSPQASIFKMTTPNKTPPGADPKQLERTGTVREIGSQAVWSLSSCKPGFGVDQLRDDNLETYWQSDGSQPHLVNIQFRRKTTVKTLCIYADYKSDESYTPSKISVRVGNNFHNLQEIRQLELVEPSGWIHVPLTDNHKKPTRTFMIQIAVLANHQNGRDTHMRQIKIYTPVEESSIEVQDQV